MMLVCLLDYANTSDPSLFDRADLLYTTIIIKSTLRSLENVIKRNYRRSRTVVKLTREALLVAYPDLMVQVKPCLWQRG